MRRLLSILVIVLFALTACDTMDIGPSEPEPTEPEPTTESDTSFELS